MASSRSLGTLTLDLILKLGGFIAGADKAERRLKGLGDSAERFGRSLGNSLKGAAAGLAGFLGITASVAGAISSIKSAIDRADNLRDFSIQLGISAESASKFSYAATQTGTSVEALSKSLIILSKNAAAALNPKSKQAGLFKALLGPDYEKDLGNLETLVPKVSDALNKLEDSTAKTGIQMQLLGRGGAELKEFFSLGSEGFKELSDRASELGIVLDQETLDAADQFNDKLADLKAATGGLATEVAAALLPQLTEMVDWAIDFVTDGDKVASLTQDLKQGFSEFADALSVAVDVGAGFLSFAARSRGALQDMQSDFQEATVRIAEFFAVYEYQIKGAQRLRDNITKDFSNVEGSPVQLQTVKVVGNLKEFAKQEAERKRIAKQTQDEINKYLATGGKSGGGSKAKKSGKSDAEKEAEALEKALRKMADAERDWQVELNDNGNPIAKEYANRLADITAQAEKFKEDGIPTKEVEAFVNKMKELATSIQSKELSEFQKEFTDETLALAAAAEGPGASALNALARETEALDKQLKNGLITLDQYNDRIDTMSTPAEEMLANLRLETELLGKTADEQEMLTAARLLGADAATAQGQAALAALRDYQEASKAVNEQIAVMDDVRAGFADFFTTIVDGSESASDAFKNLIDDIFASLTRWATNKLVEDFLGSFGSTQSGSSGSGGFDWGALLGSFMGGGKASGGWTAPGMINAVNERGFEMASVGGRDYMLTGNRPVEITPHNRLGGANQTNNFIFAAPTEQRTQQQVAQRVGYETNRALVRNR